MRSLCLGAILRRQGHLERVCKAKRHDILYRLLIAEPVIPFVLVFGSNPRKSQGRFAVSAMARKLT